VSPDYPAKLKEHQNIHEGVLPFACTVPGCEAGAYTRPLFSST
jgi:hypothetical protein